MTKPDLDEVLRDVVESIHHEEVSGPDYTNSVDDTVAQLKEAFHEAGYVNVEPACNMANHKTGQSFYDAFEKELKRQGSNSLEPRMLHPHEIEANVLEAAKRAAGLNEVEG